MTAVNIQEYKKSIVVCGDTKPIKDALKSIGGKWNSKLKNDDGTEFGGWIFSPTKRQEIETLLAGNSTEPSIKPIVKPSIKPKSIEETLQEILNRLTIMEDRQQALEKTVASWLTMNAEENSADE